MPLSRSKRNSKAKRRLDFGESSANESTAAASSKRGTNFELKLTDSSPVSFSSPVAKRAKVSIVTPATEESKPVEAEYVPKYIHKNLDYVRRGHASLPKGKIAVFEEIVNNYIIPEDFEQSRANGPLSGTTFEEKVIQAYSLGKLEPKTEEEVKLCTACSEVGHLRDECPTLV